MTFVNKEYMKFKFIKNYKLYKFYKIYDIIIHFQFVIVCSTSEGVSFRIF